jgi:hypothetical protein
MEKRMSDIIDIELTTIAKQRHIDKENSDDSRRAENRERVKRVFKQIGEGKTPTIGIASDTPPSYWVIRTDDWAWEQDECEDQFVLENDDVSQDQLDLWRNRGGRVAMLRLSADPGSNFIRHVFVWLVDTKTGHSCVGVNFQAQPATASEKVIEPKQGSGGKIIVGRERLIRRFIVVEDELSRNVHRLLRHLRRRGAVELDIENLREALGRAPTIIVMPEASIDFEGWDIRSETIERLNDIEDLDADGLDLESDLDDEC